MLELCNKRGKMIVLCGIDGCGKTTIINHLLKEQNMDEVFKAMKHPPQEWFDNPRISAAFLDGDGDKMSVEELDYVLALDKKWSVKFLQIVKWERPFYSIDIFFRFLHIMLALELILCPS